MADWTTVAGDTEPLLYEKLTYSNGEKVDLEGATIKFIARLPTAAEPVALTGKVTVTAVKEGELYFAPSAADTAMVGNYMANWHVTFAGGEEQTFPTVGYLWWQVQPNLTGLRKQLIGVPEVKQRLYGPSADHTHDEMLAEDIEAVTALIENLTGPVLPTVFDEWYEGGHSTIALRHVPSYGYGSTPIFTLLAVSEYRGPIEYNLALVPTPTAGSVYSAMAHGELGTIVRRTAGGGTYPFWSDPSHPEQSVHVVYYVGQQGIPAVVRRAAVETIRWWHLTTEMVGKGSLDLANSEPIRPHVALPYHVEAMLAPMRRAPVCA